MQGKGGTAADRSEAEVAHKAVGAAVGDQGSGDAAIGAPTLAANGLTRVTVNLNRQAVQALESVSDQTGYSKTDTINRALQLYAIVQDIMRRDGGVLRITHDDGTVERIHIV